VLAARCAVAGAALTLSACGNGDPQLAEPAIVPQVVVVTLQQQRVPLTRELAGRTSAYEVAEVRPQVSGIVKRQLFIEGSRVQAGQPLYDLDDALYRAQADSASANLLKARATLHAAQLAATRSRELIRANLVSAQDNEKILAAEAEAEAEVAAAEAALATSHVNLAYAHIVAPISGRIGRSMITRGALVTAEQAPALATIHQLDPIYVEVTQTSGDWLALRQAIDAGRVQVGEEGAPVKILLENGSTYEFEGTLRFADASVDRATGNLMLHIIVPNPKLLLLPGMYVRAVLTEGALSDGVLVPQQAIARDPKGAATALLVTRANKVELRTVQVSRTIGDHWLVDDGLAAGERVIVEGIQKAKPGAEVTVVERTAAAEIAP